MDEERAAQLLGQARERVERALAELGQPVGDDEGDSHDPAAEAPDLLEAEIEEGLVAPLRKELEAIERAERRLADGTYGLSVESGQPIPDARLEAIPWAERSVEEEQQR